MDIRNRKPVDNRPAIFSVPKVKNPSNNSIKSPIPTHYKKNLKLTKRRKKIFFVGVVVFIITVTQISVYLALRSPTETANEPNYNAILPEGRPIASLGGWQRVSPPGKEPVYAYNDKITDTSINISQQPLPDSFKGSVAASIGELAKSYNATSKLQVGDTTVYLGISSKGPQSVIFTKEGLLVLVMAEKKIADADWSAYVSSLSSTNLERLPKY